MTRSCLSSLICAFGLFWSAVSWGQVEYVMDNLVVTDCYGELVDSGEGEEYSSNENFTFTVELEQGIPISVFFLQAVCIEEDFDFLEIWDGLAPSGTLLASITGSDFIPDPVVANSGTVTFVFTSDNSLNLCGFALGWEGLAPPPVPPVIGLEAEPACGATGLDIAFSFPLGCSDVGLDSLEVISGPVSDLDLANAVLACDGDSTTGFFLPFTAPVDGNCTWELALGVAMRDGCDSLHQFTVEFEAAVESCPIQGEWGMNADAACLGECIEVYWFPAGCAQHTTAWIESAGGQPIPDDDLPPGADIGLTLCIADGNNLELELAATQWGTGLNTVLSYTIEPQIISMELSIPTPVCSAGGDVEIATAPAGGTWDGPTYFSDGMWWLDAAQAGVSAAALGGSPLSMPITYTTAEGCALDTTVHMQYVEAGADFSTCLGADPIPLSGTSDLPATWLGYVTPVGLFNPDSIGTFELYYNASGCVDTVTIEVAPAEPPVALGDVCQTAGNQPLPNFEAAGYWTGPALIGDAFDPEVLSAGVNTWLYNLTGCNYLAVANILPIDIGDDAFTSCPEQDAFIPSPSFTPAGGTWQGAGISNSITGLFDPGNAPEGWNQPLVYTAPNGCLDTLLNHNITTAVAPSYETCNGLAEVDLHGNEIAAVPWCGTWTGTWPGATSTPMAGGNGNSLGLSVSSWCDWVLEPDEIPPGIYELTFTANTCSDDMVLQVFPSELNLDPIVVCSDADPLELAPVNWPLGGVWNGSGIHSETGTLTPGSAMTGWQDVTWTAPGGCTDIVEVNVEAWEQAAFVSLDSVWCHQSIVWEPELFPSQGCTWELDGTAATEVLISSLDTGYHQLNIAWNGAACSSFDTVSFFMLSPLEVTLSVNDTTLCPGVATTASAVANGGQLPDVLPTWSWSNGGFAIDNTTYLSDSSQFLVVTAMDGCSDPATDSVYIEAVPPAIWSLTYGDTLCFGDPAEALMACSTPMYELWWDGQPASPDLQNADTSFWMVSAPAGSALGWQLIHSEHGCTVGNEAITPAFSPVSAGFTVNPGLECVPWDFLPLQLIDYSQFGLAGNWSARTKQDGQWQTLWDASYTGNTTPEWQPEQPGDYQIVLSISNEGGCTSTDTAWVCVHAPVKWFLADQFSPNGDNLNDVLLVRSEPLEAFHMEVYNRYGQWIWESTDPDIGWDGRMRNQEAPSAVYAVRLTLDFEDGTLLETSKYVTLVR